MAIDFRRLSDQASQSDANLQVTNYICDLRQSGENRFIVTQANIQQADSVKRHGTCYVQASDAQIVLYAAVRGYTKVRQV